MTCYPTEVGGWYGIDIETLEPCYVSLLGLIEQVFITILSFTV